MEIRNAHERLLLAPYLADCGLISWISSEYREAHRSLMESRVNRSESVEEDLHLINADLVGQSTKLLNLLLLGDWGGALREMEDAIATLDKNGNYHWERAMHLHQAWVHLHAIDFAGALAICDSALPLLKDPEPPPAPDYSTQTAFTFRNHLALMGAAETALGDYESPLEHLLAARSDMDREAAIFDWY